ncbi:MAG: nucleotidyltransferase family protein [Oscillospiraceae bacterium]|jgi:CTP:molybdopterin cytidylyltransferase MocA|nr:nucleotidyltransferase family protein [Oscillospiraceae bacterium]
MPNCAAIILAAGYSSRMGTLKPLLELGGVPALSRVIGAFRDSGVSDISVVTGYERERLAPLLRGVTEVVNERFDEGMFTSVRAGVAACKGDYALITPADCALLNRGIIGAVIDCSEGNKIVIPRYNGEEGHPVLISRELFSEILSYDGSGGLRGLLERYASEIVRVDVFDEGAVLDMDTPEDYEKLKMIFDNNA